MDSALAIIGFICCVVGLLGSFLPVLPGPALSWVGLLLVYLTKTVENNYWVLGFTLVITLVISILDYVIPAQGTKRFGGTKYGIWGTNIGLTAGLFFPPFGFIIGPFVGAFVGELVNNSEDKNGALKAAFGSFLGFLVSTFMKFIVCFSFLILYCYIIIVDFM